MRRVLTIAILWVLAAPAWAGDIWYKGYYNSVANAMSACNAEFGGCLNGGVFNSPYKYNYAGNNYYFVVYGGGAGGCPGGQVPNSTGLCVAACTYEGLTTIPASDPSCVEPPPPPPTCPTGEPATISINYGTQNSADPNDYTGGSLNFPYCNGTCEIGIAEDSGNQGCTYPANGPFPVSVVCTITGELNGNTCSTSNTATEPTGQTSTATASASASCPAGSTLTAAGICQYPATPGTAATSTTAGTASTSGAASCPVGYHDEGGKCVGDAPAVAGINCPNGYTINAQGNCEASTVISSSTTGTAATEGTASAEAGAGQAVSDSTAVQNALTGAASGTPSHGWTWGFSNLMLPTDTSCTPLVISTGGRSMTMDYCTTAAQIRAVGEYFLYLTTVFVLFNILTGRRDA